MYEGRDYQLTSLPLCLAVVGIQTREIEVQACAWNLHTTNRLTCFYNTKLSLFVLQMRSNLIDMKNIAICLSLFCWEYLNQKNISKTNFKYLTLCAQCFISWSCAQNPCNLPSIDRIRFGFALLRRKVNHYLTF